MNRNIAVMKNQCQRSTYVWKNTRLVIFSLWVLVLIACAGTRDYDRAVLVNSIGAYEGFLQKHPSSKYKPDVEVRLNRLYDERAWKHAVSGNTIDSYRKYLSIYVDGKYVYEAKENIARLERELEIENAWGKAKLANNMESYLLFINMYPKSSFVFDARMQISKLQDQNAWRSAEQANTMEGYKQYLNNFPSGYMNAEAKRRIDKIWEDTYILPYWKEVQRKNTYQAYLDFEMQYPNSSYVDLAAEKRRMIDRKAWEVALITNSIKGFKAYLNKFPYGDYTDSAEKKIIDLEVDNIFKGNHSKLPPLSRSGFGSSAYTNGNKIEIFNNTKYTLVVRYSGEESKKVEIASKRKVVVQLKNGNYRITASVNAANVQNYAGTEYLRGGEYNSEFYIVTQTTRSWSY